MRSDRLKNLFCCPVCRAGLRWDTLCCAGCGKRFRDETGVIDFIDRRALSAQEQKEIELHANLAGEYEKRYHHEFTKVYSDYWNRQFLDNLSAETGIVLDCGCGTGDLAGALLRHCNTVVGMDISAAMILQGRTMLQDWDRVTWVSCPAETMPFADSCFDAVCFRGALHHMPNPASALAEAARLLRPGGILLLSEPNDDSLLLRLPRWVVNRRLARFGNQHQAFRSEPWLRTIENSGFTILQTKYFSFLSQPLCGMSDLLPLLRVLPGATRIARGLVRFDEFCSRLPLVRRQSFDLFVAARKR